MENASKALIIAGAILLSILIIALGIFVFNAAKGAVNTDQLDATEIHPAFNAFEKGDDTTLYIYAPDNFGKVDSINISLSSAGILTPGGDWKVENITATHVSGNNRGFSKTLMTDTWIDG